MTENTIINEILKPKPRARYLHFSRLLLILIMVFLLQLSKPIIWSQSEGYEDIQAKPAEIHWVQTGGPPGGTFSKLIQNSVFHNELYAQTANGRIFKSVNKGEDWHLLELSSD